MGVGTYRVLRRRMTNILKLALVSVFLFLATCSWSKDTSLLLATLKNTSYILATVENNDNVGNIPGTVEKFHEDYLDYHHDEYTEEEKSTEESDECVEYCMAKSQCVWVHNQRKLIKKCKCCRDQFRRNRCRGNKKCRRCRKRYCKCVHRWKRGQSCERIRRRSFAVKKNKN